MIQIPSRWRDFLGDIDISEVVARVECEYETKCIFPPKEMIFRALELLSPEQVKVVIIGQDPYHGEGQACGLSFSVADGVKFPPSLVNIFKELVNDIGVATPATGDLVHWAEQGVLLLNSTLTVESGRAASHKNIGWEPVTQHIINTLAEQRSNIVYILWGSYAQKIGRDIDATNNLVINEVHPSPLSSYRGFFGSKPFSKANSYLVANKKTEIKW